MIRETRCRPLLTASICVFIGLMLLGIMFVYSEGQKAQWSITNLRYSEDQKGQWSITNLRKAIGDLHGEEGCLLGSHRLPLGDHLAWGFEHDREGMPLSCSFCKCDLRTADEQAFPKCFIESCSSSQRWCPHATERHEAAQDAAERHEAAQDAAERHEAAQDAAERHEAAQDAAERHEAAQDAAERHEPAQDAAERHEPAHPCCGVCRPQRPPPNETAEPEILASVPYTGDIYNSSFRHLPTGLCSGSPAVLLVVTSVPAAAARRAILRRLYQTDLAAHRVQLVFLLGRPGAVRRAFNDFTEEDFEFVSPEAEARARQVSEERAREAEARAPATQRAVDAEAAAFDDVIQSDVAEHYFHLSLKTVSLLDAVRRRCPRLRFVAKTDDDVFVTVRRLAAEAATLNATRAIYGRLQERPSVSRSLHGWYSSEREWPWPRYPEFVLGPGYLISGDAAGDLYWQALRTRYLHLEDVYVTGVVAAAAGVARRHWAGLCPNYLSGVNVCQAARCVFTHRVDMDLRRVSLEHLVNASQRFDVEQLCTPRAAGL